MLQEQCMGLHTSRQLNLMVGINKSQQTRAYPNFSYLEEACFGIKPDISQIAELIEKSSLPQHEKNSWMLVHSIRAKWPGFTPNLDLLFISVWSDIRHPLAKHKKEKWSFPFSGKMKDTIIESKEFEILPPLSPENSFLSMLSASSLWRQANPNIQIFFFNYPVLPPLPESSDKEEFSQTVEELDIRDKKIEEMSKQICPVFGINPIIIAKDKFDYRDNSMGALKEKKERYHFHLGTYEEAAKQVFKKLEPHLTRKVT